MAGISNKEGRWYNQLIDGSMASIDSIDVLVEKIDDYFVGITSDFVSLDQSDISNFPVLEIQDDIYAAVKLRKHTMLYDPLKPRNALAPMESLMSF